MRKLGRELLGRACLIAVSCSACSGDGKVVPRCDDVHVVDVLQKVVHQVWPAGIASKMAQLNDLGPNTLRECTADVTGVGVDAGLQRFRIQRVDDGHFWVSLVDVPAPEEQVVKFLTRIIAPVFTRANEVCRAALDCGTIERSPKPGAVGREDEMGPCYAARIPECDEAMTALHDVEPPNAIAALWPLFAEQVAWRYEEARITSKLIRTGATPQVLANDDQRGTLRDWGRTNSGEYRAALDDLERRIRAYAEVPQNLDAWVSQHGLCAKGVRCTAQTIIEADKANLAPQYAGYSRLE